MLVFFSFVCYWGLVQAPKNIPLTSGSSVPHILFSVFPLALSLSSNSGLVVCFFGYLSFFFFCLKESSSTLPVLFLFGSFLLFSGGFLVLSILSLGGPRHLSARPFWGLIPISLLSLYQGPVLGGFPLGSGLTLWGFFFFVFLFVFFLVLYFFGLSVNHLGAIRSV